MLSYNTLVVLLGTGLLGLAAGLVGTFAVLRQRALVGDALAHAALPGLSLAFLVVGERSLPALLAWPPASSASSSSPCWCAGRASRRTPRSASC
jgi:manganese/zinc/iron transport system permease protein